MSSARAGDPANVIGSRREARETALGILYTADTQQIDLYEVLDAQTVVPIVYTVELVEGIAGALSEVDALVSRFADGWSTGRMPAIDLALVRIAVYELLYRPDVPTSAVLAEVVELADDYSTDRSARFVNGIVAAVADEVRGRVSGEEVDGGPEDGVADEVCGRVSGEEVDGGPEDGVADEVCGRVSGEEELDGARISQLAPASSNGSWPSVAVVVPNHSRIVELRETITSVELQDYSGRVHIYLVYWPRPEIEPLLVELGNEVTAIPSVDESGRNSLAHKRNLAIRASSEELVAFIDDDDVWHPSKLRAQVEALRSNSGLVAVGTGVVNFTGGEPEWANTSCAVRPLGWYRRHLPQSLCTSSLLMVGDAIRELMMDERSHWLGVSDYHLKLRLGLHGGLAKVEGSFVGYRVGHDAMFAQDIRHNWALGLSVIASAGEVGVGGVARRLVALHMLWVAVWETIGIGVVTDRAADRTREALDGRLFGPLDRLVQLVLVAWWRMTVGWKVPRRLIGRARRLLR